MENSTIRDEDKLIPLKDVCAALNCRPRTALEYLARFGIPVCELSERKRGVLYSDYQKLITRLRQ